MGNVEWVDNEQGTTYGWQTERTDSNGHLWWLRQQLATRLRAFACVNGGGRRSMFGVGCPPFDNSPPQPTTQNTTLLSIFFFFFFCFFFSPDGHELNRNRNRNCPDLKRRSTDTACQDLWEECRKGRCRGNEWHKRTAHTWTPAYIHKHTHTHRHSHLYQHTDRVTQTHQQTQTYTLSRAQMRLKVRNLKLGKRTVVAPTRKNAPAPTLRLHAAKTRYTARKKFT